MDRPAGMEMHHGYNNAAEIPQPVSGKVLVVYRELREVQPYARALEAAGAEPVLAKARTGLGMGSAGGILLTGGDDVNPKLYGENAAPETESPDDERDAVEAALIDEALKRDLPLLAICRGLQILNVRLGGSLIQHLPGAERHVRRTPDRGLPAHRVSITPGTKLAAIAGRETWEVNSRHHQAIARLGRGLQVSARDTDDGTIEAIEYRDRRYVLAVQWHPENQAVDDPEQRKLFQSFAASL
jgi:putative glutamine amidotransferase